MKRVERLHIKKNFGLVIAVYLMRGCVTVGGMLLGYGEPRGASEWTTAGTLPYDYLTFGLLVAAVYAGLKVNEQIQQTERHHKQQLQASLRPHVRGH